MSPEEVRERYERVCGEVGPGVTVVAATKYVALGELGVLAEAGIPVVGENRAQDLRPSTRRSAMRFAGTSSAICRAERR